MRWIVVFVAGTLLVGSSAPARVWHVPGEAPTIQAGIDSALTGDVVELAAGVYTGPGNRDLDFRGKAITVRSRDLSPETCIIDCQGTAEKYHRGFHFQNNEGLDSVIEGLTITNGFHIWSGGVFCEDGKATISNCRFINNRGGEGAGLSIHTHCEVFDCWFEGNVSSWAGGGVSVCCGGEATLTRCTFVGNTAEDYGGGYRT